MVYVGTKINIVDNSGVKRAKCIHIYTKNKCAKPGDQILVSVRTVRPTAKIKRGQVFKAILVRCPFRQMFYGGHFTVSILSAAILLKKNGDILGTRFFGPIYWKLYKRRLSKALSLYENII